MERRTEKGARELRKEESDDNMKEREGKKEKEKSKEGWNEEDMK